MTPEEFRDYVKDFLDTTPVVGFDGMTYGEMKGEFRDGNVTEADETIDAIVAGTAEDVIEMMMAGATVVQVGAANLKDPYACKRIIEDLPAEMERLGIERLRDIIGIVK